VEHPRDARRGVVSGTGRSGYNIAVDIGGTFTDCVIHDVAGGRIVAAKSPSRREHLGGGVLDAVRAGAERLGVPVSRAPRAERAGNRPRDAERTEGRWDELSGSRAASRS
jgi:hypothetical protein